MEGHFSAKVDLARARGCGCAEAAVRATSYCCWGKELRPNEFECCFLLHSKHEPSKKRPRAQTTGDDDAKNTHFLFSRLTYVVYMCSTHFRLSKKESKWSLVGA